MTAAAVDSRRRELAAIHAAKRDLALVDDSYRAILERVAGVASAAALDEAGRRKVLDHFRALGWSSVRRPRRAGTRALADSALARKLRALWLSLYQLGEVEDPRESALAAFVERQTGKQALQFLTPAQFNQCIEALKDWCARAGFQQPTTEQAAAYDRIRERLQMVPGGVGFAARCALIEALWRRLIALGAMRTGAQARLDTWLRRYGVAAPHFLALDDADRAIEALGAWVRRVQSGARAG